MTVDSRKRGSVTILEPRGKLQIGIGDLVLRDAVDRALASGDRELIVDLHAVTRIDSSGMAELIAAYGKAKEAGGVLRLLRLPPKVQSILGATQLNTVFDVFDSEDEAVASFG